MNIFYLDSNPLIAATYQVDKHVVKMILESAQLLSTAHWYLDGAPKGYAPTHKNHPCAVWVRESAANYWWLVDHALALCDEYEFRYGRKHKTYDLLYNVLHQRPRYLKNHDFTTPPQAMPDEFKEEDTILAYRHYYAVGKEHLHSWTKREKPEWINNYV